MRISSRPAARAAAATVLVVALLVLTLVAGPGCGKTKVVTKTVPATTPKATVPSSASTAAVPIILQASGNATTQPFTLTAGLAIFVLGYTGGDGFQASLVDDGGHIVSQLYNLTGNANGATALGVSAGRYSLNVNAGGQWSVTVNQGVAVNPQPIPLNDSGTGPQVTPFFQSSGGNATVNMSYNGTSPFVVTLLSAGGEIISTLANVPTGPFTGTQNILMQQGSIYLIDVEGNGAWTLNVH
jgi:hypothetical protein